MSISSGDVESLTVVFAGLRVSIRRRAGHPIALSVSDLELVSAEEPEAPLPPTRSPDTAILAAYSPEALQRLSIPELDTLSRRLTGTAGTWTGAARVARAFRAGLGARQHLLGGSKISSPQIPGFRNVYYIVLRAPGVPSGAWTRSFRTCPRGSFDINSSSHSLPSLVEAEAYLLGAEREWPEERQ